jgi:hypothetical protein
MLLHIFFCICMCYYILFCYQSRSKLKFKLNWNWFAFIKRFGKLENISILYISFAPKILIFVEAGAARLPLFHSHAAQLEAQHAQPAGGLRPHGAEAETEQSSSPTGEKSFP